MANAEFTTLRLRLIKIAARVMETASRVRLAFVVAPPEAALFASLAMCLETSPIPSTLTPNRYDPHTR